jgi:lipopolysaccharide transport system ATP-binding protein
MMSVVISVEGLSKAYRLGQIGTGTFTNDLRLWWAKVRGKPNPLLRVGETEHGNHAGETLWALKDVSFTVNQGEVLGIIGRNGAGKSTLLKILSRVTAPTSGRIRVKGRVASLLEVGTGFHPELTGRENIYLNGAILGMSRAEVTRKFDEIVDFAEVEKFIDTPVKRYSSGMYVRLAFAVAAHLEPEILVVDEVLAVGDAEFQKKCLGKMGDVARKGRTVLFVSHNMDAILNICPQTIVIAEGRNIYQGQSETAVNYYLGPADNCATESAAHVIYSNSGNHSGANSILRIELLDQNRTPKQLLSTWDDVVFRIHYEAREQHLNGSFLLDIWDSRQQRLVVFDSGLKYPIRKGKNTVDCFIPKFPLAAGNYFLGAGLSVSRHEWLWREKNLVQIRVGGRDVFELGRPPSDHRMLFAAAHTWSADG